MTKKHTLHHQLVLYQEIITFNSLFLNNLAHHINQTSKNYQQNANNIIHNQYVLNKFLISSNSKILLETPAVTQISIVYSVKINIPLVKCLSYVSVSINIVNIA